MDAFENVVRRFQREIRAWSVVNSPPGVDADEVAQKTFIAACQRIGDYEIGTNFRAWLYAIARYQLMSEITKMKRIADYHRRHAPELISREFDRYAEEETPLETVNRLAALRLCLSSLDEKGNQLLAWRYDEGIPLAEMSERSGRSIGALKKGLFMLRKKLQACIEGKLETREGLA